MLIWSICKKIIMKKLTQNAAIFVGFKKAAQLVIYSNLVTLMQYNQRSLFFNIFIIDNWIQ
jgi:hypothetical protein